MSKAQANLLVLVAAALSGLRIVSLLTLSEGTVSVAFRNWLMSGSKARETEA